MGRWQGGTQETRPHPPFPSFKVRNPASPLPRDIATVLYFAGIVVALTRCGERISQLDDAALRAGIEWAMSLPRLDEETRDALERLRRGQG